MITLEQLNATGIKADLIAWWAAAQAEVASGGPNAEDARSAMETHRHPDTVLGGVLTKEQVEDWIGKIQRGEAPKYMMLGYRLSVISDRTAFYLTDDYMWGHRVLPENLRGCSFPLPLSTANRIFDSVEEFCQHYCKGERYLATAEELVEYVNSTYP